jgi:hypothetical protein
LAANGRHAVENNRRGGRRRETADRMHCLADGAGRHLVMGRLVLIAGRDGHAAGCETDIRGEVDAERPGEGHARGMVKNRDKRLQPKRKDSEPRGPPMHVMSALVSHGRE